MIGDGSELQGTYNHVSLLVSRRLGEFEFAKRRAAGWRLIQAPQMEIKGGRILFFADPGSQFQLGYGRIAPGLRIVMRDLPSDILLRCGFSQLPPMPVWLIRLASRPYSEILGEIAESFLYLLEEQALKQGDMPAYLEE